MVVYVILLYKSAHTHRDTQIHTHTQINTDIHMDTEFRGCSFLEYVQVVARLMWVLGSQFVSSG